MSLTLFELRARDGQRYSQFSWRSTMALAHKGLKAEHNAVRVSDKAAIAFSSQDKVPILVDGKDVIADSWKIAEHLESRYPDAPSLFGGPIGHGVTQAFNTWTDRVLVPAMLPVIVADIHERVDPRDDVYFRQMMEKIVRTTLEEARAQREAALGRLGRAIEPLQATFKRQAFMAGAAPAYADYILLSVFQWARVMSPHELLAPEDPLCQW